MDSTIVSLVLSDNVVVARIIQKLKTAQEYNNMEMTANCRTVCGGVYSDLGEGAIKNGAFPSNAITAHQRFN